MKHSVSLHSPQPFVLQSRGRVLDISEGSVMGILNITPDSFYDGGKFTEESVIIERAEKMIQEGAQIIDIGGVSTRPGAGDVSLATERERVLPFVRLLRKRFPEVFLSVDTFRSQIARESLDEGIDIINDISAGNIDPEIIKVAGEARVIYILMHMQGVPATMQTAPQYDDLLAETGRFFAQKIASLRAAGCNEIILDPGFGFGKTTEHNYRLLKNTGFFKSFGLPLIYGFSRKSMINKLLNINPLQSLNGTTAVNTIALLEGVHILRVHDVKEAVEALKITKYYRALNP